MNAPEDIAAAIQSFLLSNLLREKVSPETIARLEAPLNLVNIRLTENGDIAPEQGGLGNLVIPGVFSLLLVLSIIFSSTYLLQGLGEEKESRLIEILLSSVSDRQSFTEGFRDWCCRAGAGGRLGPFHTTPVEPGLVYFWWVYQYDTIASKLAHPGRGVLYSGLLIVRCAFSGYRRCKLHLPGRTTADRDFYAGLTCSPLVHESTHSGQPSLGCPYQFPPDITSGGHGKARRE